MSTRHEEKAPALALALLRWFCKPEYHLDIEGDLLQMYQRRCEDHGHKIANRLFYKDVLLLFRPGIIRSFRHNQKLNYMDLFQHNLKVSFRSFRRHTSSFLINLLGLSSGLACVLLIYLWISDELSMNQYHEHSDRLYQLLENVEQNGQIITRQTSAGPTAAALAEEFSEVEYAATRTWVDDYMVAVGDKKLKADAIFASKDYFELFTFDFLEGQPAVQLKDRNTIAISDELGFKLFGTTENLVGREIEWQKDLTLKVTGVFRKLPSSASLKFDFVLPFQIFWDTREWVRNWYNTAPRTFLLLKEGASVAAFNENVHDLIREKTEGNASHRSPFAAKYADRYLYGHYENGVQAGGRIEYVRMFGAIAVFILFIACINFMNLSTARASRRLKEVGVKKTVGASRPTLIGQYLGESTLLVCFSMLVALVCVWLLIPQFNVLTDKTLSLTLNQEVLTFIFSTVVITGFIAGSYPALYLSGFSPAKILRGKLNKSTGESWARKGLVTFQFALSLILIVSVVVIYKQLNLTQTKNLGYDRDNVILFDVSGELSDSTKYFTFSNQVANLPGVLTVSGTNHSMVGHNGGTYGLQWPGKDPDDRTEFETMFISYGFIEMMEIDLLSGRTFDRKFSGERNKIVFNEAAIKFIGFENPVGQKITLWGNEVEIIGVVKDFHFDSFHEEIKPAFLKLEPRTPEYLIAKIAAGRESETIGTIEELHREFNPGFDPAYRFLDESYQRMYTAESRVSSLSKYFAGVAIIISCLGLFGLASFTLERRSKEIGIRKVLGSSDFSLIRKLSTELLRMVLVAVLVGLPFSYFATNAWLDNFAFRIELEWWFFAAAGLTTLIIAMATVSFQTVKAALINPVRYLRDE